MIQKLLDMEINAEMIGAFIFSLISATYIYLKYGFSKIFDSLFLWMFPASIMIFLTLLIVKVIEGLHERRVKNYKYLNLSRN